MCIKEGIFRNCKLSTTNVVSFKTMREDSISVQILSLRPFFIIDWFNNDPPTLLFGKLKKNKIENPYFLFPPLLIFLLIMHRKIKTIKTVAYLVPQ